MKTLLLIVGLLQIWSAVEANWQDDALKLHNKYRAAHGSPKLVLDSKLNKQAQQCANRVANLNSADMNSGWKLVHTENRPNFGENLSGGYGGKSAAVIDATQRWYKEKDYYDYNRGVSKSSNQEVGHFTQMVWKDSKRFGIGIAYKGKRAFVCAHYSPPGNFPGAQTHRANVKKG